MELRFSLRSCRIELDAGAILVWTCSVFSVVRIEKRIRKGRRVKKMRTVFHKVAPENILSRLAECNSIREILISETSSIFLLI